MSDRQTDRQRGIEADRDGIDSQVFLNKDSGPGWLHQRKGRHQIKLSLSCPTCEGASEFTFSMVIMGGSIPGCDLVNSFSIQDQSVRLGH